jgi:hypothetical protein
MVTSAQLTERDAQMSFGWEFPPTIQQETAEDEAALCRWEDDGGAVGRMDADDK